MVYRYFSFSALKGIGIETRGGKGSFEVSTSADGAPVAVVEVGASADWKEHTAPLEIPDGIHQICLRFRGDELTSVRNIRFF